jgi:hypothetical protein
VLLKRRVKRMTKEREEGREGICKAKEYFAPDVSIFD